MAYSTINKHTDYFNTKLWTGNGSAGHAITGVGHQPDLTWIKVRGSAGDNGLWDSVRGVSKRIQSNENSAETTTSGVTAFGTDGFTMGTAYNVNNDNYASWNWKAGGGQGSSNTDGSINTTYTSVNTTAGFSICKWTGTGSAGTIGHGLGAVPKMIICKNTNTNVNWIVYHNKLDATAPQNKYVELNASTGVQDYPMWNDTAPTSSVFSVGSDPATNKSGSPIIAYCFAEKKGYSKFGSYTGNANADGPFIYLGFKPALFIFKRFDATKNWHLIDGTRDIDNPTQTIIYPDLNDAEQSTTSADLVSNGVKVRNGGSFINETNGTYLYMAFAENPIVGSNKTPAVAK